MGYIYKELLAMVKDDLESWDWEDPYFLEEDTGKAILELLLKRENRNKYLRTKYKEDPNKRREYQREWVKKNRPSKKGVTSCVRQTKQI